MSVCSKLLLKQIVFRTPEKGLVTAALKIKRPAIDTYYKSDVDQMYDNINREFSPPANASQGKLPPV